MDAIRRFPDFGKLRAKPLIKLIFMITSDQTLFSKITLILKLEQSAFFYAQICFEETRCEGISCNVDR